MRVSRVVFGVSPNTLLFPEICGSHVLRSRVLPGGEKHRGYKRTR